MLEPKQISSLSEDNQAVLRALTQAIRLSSGFNLLFAKCNFAQQRDELIQIIRQQIPDIFLVELNEPQQDLHAYIESVLPDHQDSPLFILGYERSIVYQSSNRNSLQILNTARESLKKLHSGPVVFWLPDYALTELAKYAPDLWAWRSGVYEFNSQLKRLDLLTNLEKAWVPGTWDLHYLPRQELLFQVSELKQQLADLTQSEEYTQKTATHLKAKLFFRLARLEANPLVNNSEAEEHFLLALDGFHKVDDFKSEIICYSEMAQLKLIQNDIESAKKFLEIGLKKAQTAKKNLSVAFMYEKFSLIERQEKNYHKALEYLRQARDIYIKSDKAQMLGMNLLETGRTCILQEQWDKAFDLINTAEKLLTLQGNQDGASLALLELGKIRQIQGLDQEALEFFKTYLDVSEARQQSYDIALALLVVGTQRLLMGLTEEAEADFQEALALSSATNSELHESLSKFIRNLHRDLGQIEFSKAQNESRPDEQGHPVN